MRSARFFNFQFACQMIRITSLTLAPPATRLSCAMVQMGDGPSVDRCISLLNNTQFFGKKMQLSYSKQAFLNDVQQPFELFDGSPSFKDFMGNRNNRFTNPEAASKNRISPPTKVLHFFNTPHGMTEDEIIQIFKQNNCATPSAVKLFQSKCGYF